MLDNNFIDSCLNIINRLLEDVIGNYSANKPSLVDPKLAATALPNLDINTPKSNNNSYSSFNAPKSNNASYSSSVFKDFKHASNNKLDVSVIPNIAPNTTEFYILQG